jgi:hypothetical protein
LFNLNTYGFDSLPCPGTALQKLLRSKIMLTEEQKLLACDVFALGASLARTLTDQYRLETIFAHGGDTEFFRKALPPSARVAEIAQGIGKREELWKKSKAFPVRRLLLSPGYRLSLRLYGVLFRPSIPPGFPIWISPECTASATGNKSV